MQEDIKIFIEYQKTFFEKENKDKKSMKYISGYMHALNDIYKIIKKNDSRTEIGNH